MKRFRPLLHTLPLLVWLVALPAPAAPASGTSIDLTAEASRPAANDLARATVFAEAAGATPSELAKRVNGLITDGLKTARAYSNVRIQSGATYTYPVYARSGKIESWRMRSDLALESTDPAALSELLGKLQGSLGVANLSMLPAPETRQKSENEATLDAITAFRARAKLIADAFGKPFRIKHLTINSSGRPPPLPMMRAATLAASDAAAMPIEAGETLVTTSVSGQIELPE